MIDSTINDDKTIAGGGEGAILAGRYHVIRQLGQGGMGSVWLAEDRQLDNRKVAFKMLPSIVVTDKRAYQQLKSEALVSLKLIHPNIVTLRAFEENNGAPFLVMDYIEGRTLCDYLAEKGKLSEAETIKLLKPIAAALDYAHGEKVIHRDVKPSNIIIRNDGHPFILDFGIAREIQESMTRVTGRTISGTLLYMSPEQLRGAPPAPAQDVYSFAAMCYECLTGRPPFTKGEIAYQIVNVAPTPLPQCFLVAPKIMKGLSKRSGNRPSRCLDLLTERTNSHGEDRKANMRYLRLITSFFVLLMALGLLVIGYNKFNSHIKENNTTAAIAAFESKQWERAIALSENADVNDNRIQFHLGMCYRQGNGLAKDVEHGMKLIREAAEHGNVKAQSVLGSAYLQGIYGVEKDVDLAKKWLLKAAEQDETYAQMILGCLYVGIDGFEEDREASIYWLRKSLRSINYDADPEHVALVVRSQNTLAEQLYRKGPFRDVGEAYVWTCKAADQGNAKSQERLGIMYLFGEGVPKNVGMGIKWLYKAAQQGQSLAQCMLGSCYEDGIGVDKDDSVAVRFYQESAKQGFPLAQARLGDMYSSGIGVAKDEDVAIEWYRKAARQGNEYAQKILREAGLSW